ncbi:peptidoglycan editing factor PgeF [Streptomyces smyrnaeus]|uniref:peptidoglycan editing factor PgeF n=1 Tax=Streptomyces TaxID=1883 RepID=UPI000C19CF9F|nr:MULTISPECIES: peptidoglycan editing factor PgeF [unclassified Streptomyces]MBQ0864725.1 peptidoglycan editing factor PgeF [Streptomyces sp. RK75]MBQ1124741.1 peptidoglycan editing factor PgeF [Streptomyces sp. B15]MBQ1159206.1 peptidoglycan editing factor PgeF [Streptomyces sp. A73]
MIAVQETAGGAHFAFTDRWGGVSAAPYEELNLGGAVGDAPEAVRTNRRRAAHALGLSPDEVVWMHQVHGRDVAVVDRPFGADAPPVDGVVTARRGLALAVLTADCTPVLLADPVAGIAGAAHAGRPGVLAGVAEATVEAMVRLGAEPERMVARTGPAVCGKCYEVPDAMRSEVAEAVPEAYATTRQGTPAVDMAAAVRAQLGRAGVTRCAQSSVCTLESADHFSYRRDKTTGRLASYVWIEAS